MTAASIRDALSCGQPSCACRQPRGNTHCPAHNDTTPSLSVDERGGKVLVNCRAGCSQGAVVTILKTRRLWDAEAGGLTSRKAEIVATYDYKDETGSLLFQVVRYAPKTFRQRRPDGSGGWTWNLRGARRVLYRLPRVIEAVRRGVTIYIVEGEKDVHAVEAAGGTATCNPGGAGKWVAEFSEALRGAHVVIVADRDEPGRKHAAKVAVALQDIAASVRAFEAAEGKDAADHLAAGHSLDDFVPMAAGQGQDAREYSVLDETPRDRTPPATISARDLMGKIIPDARWAVDRIVPDGLTVLASKPKLGKSWLVLGLGVAIASGGRALGSVSVTGGDVLYLALEDNERRLQSRLSMLLEGAPAPEHLTLATRWPPFDEGGLDDLEAWLFLHPDARLIVVDTLAKVRPRRGRNGNAYDEDHAALAPLKEIADRRGLAVIVVHHLRKMAADDPFDTVSGTLGLTGTADTIMVMQRERGQHDAALHITGRDVDEREIALRWHAQAGTWSILGDAAVYRMTEERSEVVRVLTTAAGPMTPTQTAKELGKSVGSVKKLMWSMREAGELQSNRRGQYTLSNLGNPVTESLDAALQQGSRTGAAVTEARPSGNPADALGDSRVGPSGYSVTTVTGDRKCTECGVPCGTAERCATCAANRVPTRKGAGGHLLDEALRLGARSIDAS